MNKRPPMLDHRMHIVARLNMSFNSFSPVKPCSWNTSFRARPRMGERDAERRRVGRHPAALIVMVVASVLLAVLFYVAASMPVPYVTMSPGPTVDVLAEDGA